MAVFPIGGQRVGIVTRPPLLDDDDQPIRTELFEPETGPPTVVWVHNAGFEVTKVDRLVGQDGTLATVRTAVATLPVVGTDIPGVVDDGGSDSEPAEVMVAVADVTSENWIRGDDGRDYLILADAVLHRDIRGRSSHVRCDCEHREA